MREIKFITWFPDTKEMTKPWTIYDILKKTDGNFEFIRKEPFCAGTGGGAIGGIYLARERPHIIMQYTGLKDKNGKEVYEGDIVKIYIDRLSDKDKSLNERMSTVKWDDYCCGFMLSFVIDVGEPVQNLVRMNVPEWIEIIGNIYENPELLEDKS